MEITDQMRSDIIRVAHHVRSHDDRPYEEADRLLALLDLNVIKHVYFKRFSNGTYECECGKWSVNSRNDETFAGDLYAHAKTHQVDYFTLEHVY